MCCVCHLRERSRKVTSILDKTLTQDGTTATPPDRILSVRQPWRGHYSSSSPKSLIKLPHKIQFTFVRLSRCSPNSLEEGSSGAQPPRKVRFSLEPKRTIQLYIKNNSWIRFSFARLTRCSPNSLRCVKIKGLVRLRR